MVTISLCMIVKNEEEVLGQCLRSVEGICDEIIVVDTGSTDATKEIASGFTDKIYDFAWIDDFSAARQYAFDQAAMDYILWLDADDMLADEDRKKLLALKRNLDPSVDVVSMLYHIAFDALGNPVATCRRNRIVKRSRGFRWVGAVHEYLEVGGKTLLSDAAVTHRKCDKVRTAVPFDRNLNIYENRLQRGEAFSPRDLFYYANELRDHRQYWKAILYYREFLATRRGWVEDQIRACLNMADCYQLAGEEYKALEALVMTMNYDAPRPEAACKIGDIYKSRNQFKQAVFWYRLALEAEVGDTRGIVQKQYSTWYPHLQLCVCYWQMGEKALAVHHNNEAKKTNPDSPQIKHNEQFFKSHSGIGDPSAGKEIS